MRKSVWDMTTEEQEERHSFLLRLFHQVRKSEEYGKVLYFNKESEEFHLYGYDLQSSSDDTLQAQFEKLIDQQDQSPKPKKSKK